MVAGGDGTIHEVINGMLTRDDKINLPIGIIPKGFLNDFAFSLQIGSASIDEALNNILAGDLLKTDITKV